MSKTNGTLRVLMIGPALNSKGGMATVERQLMKLLPNNGVEAAFISTYKDGSKAKKLLVAAYAYVRFCAQLPKYDLVHVHMASRGSYERKRVFINHALKCNKPVVLHLHGGEFGVWFDTEVDDSKRSEIRNVFNSAAAIVVLSEEWRDWMIERDFSPKSIVVLHNGVGIPPHPCHPQEHQNILFVGHLDANKSPEVLLQASSRVLDKYPDVHIVFAGDGSSEHYQSIAQELGIANRCVFPGWVTGDKREEFFSSAGIFCLPSKHEGMPMSVLEAMAHGIPTITTPVGGIPQVIQDGVDGFLFPVDNVTRLSELLDKLLDNADLRKCIGEAGRKKVGREFSSEDNINRLVNLYEEVVNNR